MKSIFDCLIEMCLSAGGDGDSCLVSPKYKEWADDFQEYLKNHSYLKFERIDSDNEIIFSRNEEAVHFTNAENEKKLVDWISTDGKIVLKY